MYELHSFWTVNLNLFWIPSLHQYVTFNIKLAVAWYCQNLTLKLWHFRPLYVMNFGCLLERSSSLLFQLNKNVKSSLNYACQTLWIELLSKSAFSQKTKLWNVSHKQNVSDAISTTHVVSWTFEVTVLTGLLPGCVFLTHSIFWREAGKEQEVFKISSFDD